MTNKEKMKKVIEEDINEKEYYNEIINRIEKLENKKNIFGWSLVPICLVIIVSGVLFLGDTNNNKTILDESNNYNMNTENDEKLNINETNNKTFMHRIDADIKIVTNNSINFPLPYGVVSIPEDLDKMYKYIFYLRENKESKEYNILGNYEIIYSNDNDRSINVKYSKENKPVRDYYFSEDGSKTSIINGKELKIYKFENNYFTEFEFNGYNFDIETSKITEQELLVFLLSILK